MYIILYNLGYNSQLLELYADFFIYKPKEPENPEDPVCAVIYEECDYKGDSFTLCDRKMSLPKDGWKKPVNNHTIYRLKVSRCQ